MVKQAVPTKDEMLAMVMKFLVKNDYFKTAKSLYIEGKIDPALLVY